MNEWHTLEHLLITDRSIRRFDATRRIDDDVLRKLIGLTRYCASGRNLQPLRYRMVNNENECALLFPHLSWAGYLTDWNGPEQEERPVAYLVQCLDTNLTKNCLCDDGLQLQAITLGATALGIGACIIKSFNPSKIKSTLSLSSHLEPLYILALGYPKETVVLEAISSPTDIKYFRTSDKIHHVPKRSVEDLIV